MIASGFIAGGALFGVFNAFLKFVDQSWHLGVDTWYVSTWENPYTPEIIGLVMFALLVTYALWDSMRAKVD